MSDGELLTRAAAAAKKKVRPPYLLEMRHTLASVKVLYEGNHKPFEELKGEFEEKRERNAGEGSPGVESVGVGLSPKRRKSNGKEGSVKAITKLTLDQIAQLKSCFNRCVSGSEQDKVQTRVQVKRFLQIVKKAASLNAFLLQVHKNIVPRMTPDILESVRDFCQLLFLLLPLRERANVQEQIPQLLEREKKALAEREKAKEVAPEKNAMPTGSPSPSMGDDGDELGENRPIQPLVPGDQPMGAEVRGTTTRRGMPTLLKKVVNLQKMQQLFASVKHLPPQVVTFEKRLELQRLYWMVSSDGVTVTKSDFLSAFENALAHANGVSNLWALHAGRSTEVDFGMFCAILLPKDYALPDYPTPETVGALTSDQIYELHFQDAQIVTESAPYLAVQGDLAKLGENAESQQLQQKARQTLVKFPIDEPLAGGNPPKGGGGDQRRTRSGARRRQGGGKSSAL